MVRLFGSVAVFSVAVAVGGCGDSKLESFSAGVGGSVNGLAGEVALVLNGGETVRVSSNGFFGFRTRLRAGAAYAVTIGAQPADQLCTVANGAGTMPYASVSNVVVNCETRRHEVMGNISGLVGALTLSNGADTYTTSTDGPFTLPTRVIEGAAYDVTVAVQPATQTCSVSNGVGTMGTSAVTNVTVVCSTNTFALGGSVSGLAGEVVLQNNAGDALTIDSDGVFVFPAAVAQGSPYEVTVLTQPATQTCTVGDGAGTMGAGDVSNVAVVCSTDTFSVGGMVSGLDGTVVLQNNGADDLMLNSDGAFTFPSAVAQGGAYAVTVLTQPVARTCAVSNGSGVMGMGDVTNVAVACSLNLTTLSVTPRAVIDVHGTGSLTVTNTGSYPALNVGVALPAGWTSVSIVSSTCSGSLMPAAACTITFTSTAPYVAQDGIEITADNVSSAPTTALAFAIDGYLVFSVDTANTASVVDKVNLLSNQWASGPATTGATSLTDGATNTATVIAQLGSNASAAWACHGSSNGGASPGMWYLPAVCQLTNAGGGANCPAGTPGIHQNLGRLGFNVVPDGGYWSSTDANFNEAWFVDMTSADPSESDTHKTVTNRIRCVRSISY